MPIKLSEIKPNPENPRIIKDEKFKKLVQSIQDFPQMLALRPIVVDENNMVLGGNMRIKAIQEAGYSEVPDEWIKKASELTEEQKREFIIKDNIGYGEWDWDVIANEWDEEQLTEWGLDLPVFPEKLQAEENEDDIPDTTIPVAEKGDLWELNNHRLLCGDSCNVSDIDRLMNGQKADLIFTDPPYDLEDNYTALILDSAHDIAHVFIMDGDVNSAKRAARFDSFRKYFVCDIRIARMISNNQPMQRHTIIAEFKKKDGKRFNNLKDGFTTLIESATDHKTIDGFNQHKRVQLPETFILHYSQPNELVADFFCGAGSTLIASEKNNRKCYLMEFEPKHCDITIKRWINYMIEHSKLFEVKRNGEKIDHKIFL